MNDTNPKYEFSDINIVPCVTTEIESRIECSPYIDNDKKLLPLFAAVNENLIKIRSSLYFHFDSSLHFHWSVVYRFLYF